MKNLVLLLVSTVLLSACANQENTAVSVNPEKTQNTVTPQQTEQTLPYCAINGHDCWEIIQLLKETEPVYSTAPETEMYSPDVAGFKNPALEAEGFSVGYYSTHNNVGLSIASLLWGESDFVTMEMSYEDENPSILKLSFSNGIKQQYDLLKKHIK